MPTYSNKINKQKAKIWLNNTHWVTETREYFLSNRPLSGAKAIAQRGSNTESNSPMCWLLQPKAFRRGMKLLTTMPLGINKNNNKINQRNEMCGCCQKWKKRVNKKRNGGFCGSAATVGSEYRLICRINSSAKTLIKSTALCQP